MFSLNEYQIVQICPIYTRAKQEGQLDKCSVYTQAKTGKIVTYWPGLHERRKFVLNQSQKGKIDKCSFYTRLKRKDRWIQFWFTLKSDMKDRKRFVLNQSQN